ncbi:hypothetical protein ScPMuIL_007996 [Solemya velum]
MSKFIEVLFILVLLTTAAIGSKSSEKSPETSSSEKSPETSSSEKSQKSSSSSSSEKSSESLKSRRCHSNEDCPANECCVGHKNGKKGKCQLLGETDSNCLVDSPMTNGIYFHVCPCGEGLYCKGEGTFASSKGEKYEEGSCEMSGPKLCSSGSDCGIDECCLLPKIMVGKRRRRQIISPQSICTKLSELGDVCLVDNGSGKPPNSVQYACPCMSGLSCHGTGYAEIPYGPIGTCEVPGPKVCSTDADCGMDECCLFPKDLRGKRRKRQITPPQPTCTKLTGLGDVCFVDDNGSGKNYACPCMSGLSCHGTGYEEIPYGPIGTCEVPGPKVCSTDADCALDECCLVRTPQAGNQRKRRQSPPQRTCTKLSELVGGS